jgi:predicted component of type VI protein secretion system
MDLLLKVVDGPSDGNWRGLEARFDASGGLIGRAETARLPLPDATRTVSRFHAHVSFSEDTFYLEEMGSRNAATINGKSLRAGNREALRPGDQVKIGHFTLAVDFDDAEFPATQVLDRRMVRMEPAENDDSTRIVTGWSGADASNAALLEALQDGAGVQLNLPLGLQPEFMRSLGLILRVLVGGLHRLASQRMRLRDEASPERARPQARNGDPVRTAAEEARLLAEVLRPAAFGSERAQARVQDMIDDLAARLAAMRTAVSAAVEQTEARLAPSAVEQRLKGSLFLDGLLPMRRKARLWDLYRKSHGPSNGTRSAGNSDGPDGGAPDASSAARELFNAAFSRAYDAEVLRLRKERV